MPPAPDAVTPHAGEISIDVSQLRPGMHVRLPVAWIEHQFMFNSFVIADEEQVRQIAAMQLPQLFSDPSRCTVPLAPPGNAPADDTRGAENEAQRAAENERLAALAAARMAEKHQRARVMSELRGRLDKAQQHYLGAARAVGAALSGFTRNPRESIRQVAQVSEESTAALLADPDSAIVLIAEKAHDDGHAAHSLSVMTLALLLGKQAKLPEAALRALGIGALLHDIGKLAISPAVLRSEERNRHEEALYQTHCRQGFDLASRAGSLSQPMLDAILRHHERFDGSGFPDRQSGNAIPLAARMVAIANRFDNLVNPLDQRRARSPSEVLSTMWTREQKAFDSSLLQLFVRAMGVYPPGSIVELSDGRVGAVVGSAPAGKPLSPKVMIYAPEVPRRQSIIIDLASDSALTVERPLRLQERPAEELDYLLPRRKINWSYLPARP
ncbi:HD domain-containing phosphohydrolase [Candidatus Accumulibacter sp. ACC003]|uniref:HD-GYP domain-containing protein n=1 Tax=Candidatus Accumulibacter sp. ACC003 TaxID=2823334 RepID=UPI0025BAD381|nr:HD domain-containing phosphohydrolase [Candidatus Accumulibacter sp. ACC003]